MTMRADAHTQAAVEAVLDRFADAYARRNVDGALDLFAAEADVTFIGTGADEKRCGLTEIKRQVERDLGQASMVHWNWVWDSVSRVGPVAWVSADAIVRVIDGQDLNLPVRLTAVLEQDETNWRIAQMHVSMPARGQEEGRSYPSD
jgi:ketosteroid isomerase-like protein